MNEHGKIKINQILSSETTVVEMNTNYLVIAKVIADRLLANGEIVLGDSEPKVLEFTNKYTDRLGDVSIIDRGRFKSILYKTIKSVTVKDKDLHRYINLAQLLDSDIGEVSYDKDVKDLIRLIISLFFSGN